MAKTLNALLEHLSRPGRPAKIAVWAHNSHLGNARATEMSTRGELNVGQLVAERHGKDAYLIGCGTHHGWVTAASDWGAPAERKRVRPVLDGSYERLLHLTGLPCFWLNLRDGEARQALREERLERAIGVIYRPETERLSHYFHARLPDQFNALIYIDETSALVPLERTSEWERGELPETFPTGI